MFRLNPNNKYQIPSANLSKLFNNDTFSTGVSQFQDKNQIRIDSAFKATPKPVEEPSSSKPIEAPLPTVVVPQTTTEIFDQKTLEIFEQLMTSRFSHIDELLLVLKERQDEIYAMASKPIQSTPSTSAQSSIAPQISPQQFQQPQQLTQPAFGTNSQKNTRTKKTYYNITDTMWLDVKSKFPDMPDDLKIRTFSDGEQFFVDNKNKKILLDNRAVLKLLNKK